MEDVGDPDKWREMAAQKEREWKECTEQRISALEKSCQEKDTQLKEEREKFVKLKEDFKYNLKLLDQRDKELDRYDATFSDLKAQLNVKTGEVSECKIQVDEIKTQLNCEVKSREELQLHYQSRLREKQSEIDSYRKYSFMGNKHNVKMISLVYIACHNHNAGLTEFIVMKELTDFEEK